ncbi:tyrosinase family protein [Azospirillum agricola]|uniref:tyrosinase family protein n=1 Tax=Azospirillum agricola TaxID=1720247 RepID=UPI000A0EF616|nr:tyrosinase family protein [Azospirillum agricola]SMH36975.1 tyrosinase [Azospirillum lipoferum]
MDRRQFIVGTLAAGTAASLLPTALPAAVSTGDKPRVRRSVMTMKADDPFFADYAKAITAMHELEKTSPSDPRTWRNQALVHLQHCPHGAEDFVHWHRYYLTYFEQICAQFSGNPDFTLPYWDWSYGTGIIPDPFYDVPALNVTYWKDRSDAQSDNWGPDEVTTVGIRILPRGSGVQEGSKGGAFTAATLEGILANTVFDNFTKSLEGTPHNTGHVVVGGTQGHMGDGMSPLDPIFWLHHCMVDRMWAAWQARGNATPPLDKNYSNQFVDGQGKPVTGITSAGSLNYPALGYIYDGITPPAQSVLTASARRLSGSAASKPVAASTQPVAFNGSAVTTIGLDTPAGAPRSLEAAAPGGRLLADVAVGSAPTLSPLLVNVFVNKPDATAETPYTDPHFVGTFSFFGGHRNHAMPLNFVLDLTKVAGQLTADGSDPTLQFVPVYVQPVAGTPPAFTIRSVRILRG